MSEQMSTLSIAEAATLSHVSTRTVRRWIARGHVDTVVHGHVRRVSAASLSEYLDRLGQAGHTKRTARGSFSDTSDTADTAAVQADRLSELVALVDRLAVENRQLTETAAVLAERCRVLGDQLALSAAQTPPVSNLTADLAETAPASAWRHLGISSNKEMTQMRGVAVLVLVAVLAAGILLLVPR